MAVTLKQGVRVAGIRPEIALAIQVADGVWERQGSELVVTSITDGKHSPTSLHYSGAAADFRIWNIDAQRAKEDLKDALGGDYDVVLEKDHIHCEFQPKSGL